MCQKSQKNGGNADFFYLNSERIVRRNCTAANELFREITSSFESLMKFMRYVNLNMLK